MTFFKALQVNVGQVDVNFIEISIVIHVWTTFVPAAVWLLRKMTEIIQLQIRKTYQYVHVCFTPSECPLSWTSRDLGWFSSELRNWDYN